MEDEQAEGLPVQDEPDSAGEPAAAESAAGLPPKEACTWGMLCHLGALAGIIVPFGNIIGPLIFWLVKRNEFAFVDEQGKNALNFQISLTIYGLISAVLCLILIGFVLLIGLLIFGLVMTIMAAVKASDGQSFRYPLTIPLFH